MLPDSGSETKSTRSMTASMMLTPRPRSELTSAGMPRRLAASKPAPVLATLISHRSSSTCSRTSYSSAGSAWSTTLVQASLKARVMSCTQSSVMPSLVGAPAMTPSDEAHRLCFMGQAQRHIEVHARYSTVVSGRWLSMVVTR